MAYDVQDSIWFGKIGIVRVAQESGPDKFYIREGLGENQEDDEQYIATYGHPVYPEFMIEWLEKGLFKELWIDGES